MLNSLHNKYDVLGVVDCDRHKDSWVDLYLDIKQYKRDEFLPNQKIIVKITKDYCNNQSVSCVLESLQILVNEIDIPNFFVCVATTNPNINDDYNTVFKKHSLDDTPFFVEFFDGEFVKEQNSDVTPYKKSQRISQNQDSVLKSLNGQQKELFFKNKSFCIIPWISMMVNTNNEVKPCCFYHDELFGNVKESSLKEIWHDTQFNEFRQKLINGKKVNGCAVCYKEEENDKTSMRQNLNSEFIHHADKVSNTNDNGSVDFFNLVYLDSRYNNLCNLTCRMCNYTSSSSWVKPLKDLGVLTKNNKALLSSGIKPGDLFDQIKTHVDTIEKLYFAGGEPMMIEEFYDILEVLDNNQRHDVRLVYNINLTKLGIKNKNIFNYWKNFKSISIGASLDALGRRGEYLRTGTKWSTVVENRLKILQERPDIDFWVASTVSNINALHLPDFHREWVEQGLIEPKNFNINLLYTPSYMNINNSPAEFKEMVKEKYLNHIKWIQTYDNNNKAVESFSMVLNALNDDVEFDKQMFWEETNKYDRYFRNRLLDSFPELEFFK